ncbi:MAG: UDP-N-acetylmuramoyl-L-alanyl-D-glutamate--2,6-diaminopimelate ligase [Deltaproteobacteria bacterium CG11_big_fil_rev_8_21_14_0_20_49_13]|nr:MAG: UDP-N-acetylmuramoyl-L-alanyl-D-glutamate--2,6-diaminopimelate ligase [Deltaproteobacteria bacterium CG11_big_fil_rev_8_21_14_0_20_49_13]
MAIKNITYDSRQVLPGYCFVAIRGEHADGHDYIESAVKNGAAVIVSDHPVSVPENVKNIIVKDTCVELARASAELFGNPSKKMRVIAVTGTNGKTTATYIIESVLKNAGRKVGVIGTIEWRYGDKKLPAPNTTPMALDLQKLLFEMHEAGVEDVVMEVSSHALDQDRVKFVDFDCGVFTNLTHDHLDYHQDVDSYFNAKEKLFSEFLRESVKRDKFAVINIDDEFGRKIRTEAKKISYGMSGAVDVGLLHLNPTIQGNDIKIKTPWGELDCKSRLRGRFNVSNILSCVAALGALGVPLKTIEQGIDGLSCVPGRLEDVENDKGITVFVDYAHTPDALQNVLLTIKEISNGKIITVFGCGGDRDRAKRPLMGDVAARYSDIAIVTSDNPRSEDPESIIREIVEGVKDRKKLLIEADRKKAIAKALSEASKGDVVLIAGKGHENYQIAGKEVRHFDDKEEATRLLGGSS